jgi:hypothetical protein
MTVETRTDLTEQLARAAVAAIADTVPTIQADPKAIRYLTVEIEVIGGRPAEARAWIERKCKLGKLLGDRGPR